MRCSSRGLRSGWASRETLAARFLSSSVMLSAYGRAAMAASCARRSFAAETIFMAFVICCVLRIEVIRLRIALRVAIFFAANDAGPRPALVGDGLKPAPARLLSRQSLLAAPCFYGLNSPLNSSRVLFSL